MYFIEIYRINQTTFQGSCLPQTMLNQIIKQSDSLACCTTIAIFKIKLKSC